MHKSIVNNHRKFCNETSNIFWEIAVFVLLFFFSAAPCIRLSVNRRSSLDWRKPGCRTRRLICWMSCMLLKLKWDSSTADTNTRADQAAIQCPGRSLAAACRVVGLFLRQDECLVWRRDATRIDEAYGTYIAWSSSQSDCLAADPRRSRWLHCRLCPSPSVPYSSVSAGICRRQCTSVVRVCWFDRCTFTVEFRQHSKVKLLVANTSCF